MSNRRAFLRDMAKASVAVAGALTLPTSLSASPSVLVSPAGRRITGAVGPDPKELAARAVEAAKKAGAAYADVRLTHDWSREMPRSFRKAAALDAERMSVGVRALVDGYWGFASGTVWSEDEMSRLALAAVALAKISATGGRPRAVDLGKIPIVKDGHWVMPIKEDPTTIPISEVLDFADGISVGYGNEVLAQVESIVFDKQDKVFASTEGSSYVQTTFSTMLVFGLGQSESRRPYSFRVPPGQGWSHVRDNFDAIRGLFAGIRAENKELGRLPHGPIEVGKYDMVLDAVTMGAFLANTLGNAIQLDRALGDEANGSGTSYINDPLAMLGTLEVGAPEINVMANRSAPGGAATVCWDDEGVVPEETALVKDGILSGFPTTRESAAWLTGWATKQGQPVRSNGCARGAEGLFMPVAHTPNLTLMPGKKEASFHDLVADLSSGLAITVGGVSADSQSLNGLLVPADRRAGGHVYKVRNGKLVAYMGELDEQTRKVWRQGHVLARTPNFWKGVEALGGPASACWSRARSLKGQPEQEVPFDVLAVPARVKQLAFIDPSRKP